MVDASRKGGHVIRLDGREHGDPQLVAPQLSVRLRVDDAIGAQHPGHEAASTEVPKSMVPTTCDLWSGLSHETGPYRPWTRPAVKNISAEAVAAAGRKLQATISKTHSSWSTANNSVAMAGVL